MSTSNSIDQPLLLQHPRPRASSAPSRRRAEAWRRRAVPAAAVAAWRQRRQRWGTTRASRTARRATMVRPLFGFWLKGGGKGSEKQTGCTQGAGPLFRQPPFPACKPLSLPASPTPHIPPHAPSAGSDWEQLPWEAEQRRRLWRLAHSQCWTAAERAAYAVGGWGRAGVAPGGAWGRWLRSRSQHGWGSC